MIFQVVVVTAFCIFHTLVQAEPTRTWKIVGELSEAERADIDLRAETPRDAQLPYLPEGRTPKGKSSVYRWFAFLLAFILLASLGVAPWALAAEERSYQALLSWLEEYRDATPTFQPGQHLTAADQDVLACLAGQKGTKS
jgi:hypothetical protein